MKTSSVYINAWLQASGTLAMYSMAVIPQLPLIHNLYPSKQEGPHSALNEEEFFDALEMAYHEDETESVSSFYNKRSQGWELLFVGCEPSLHYLNKDRLLLSFC